MGATNCVSGADLIACSRDDAANKQNEADHVIACSSEPVFAERHDDEIGTMARIKDASLKDGVHDRELSHLDECDEHACPAAGDCGHMAALEENELFDSGRTEFCTELKNSAGDDVGKGEHSLGTTTEGSTLSDSGRDAVSNSSTGNISETCVATGEHQTPPISENNELQESGPPSHECIAGSGMVGEEVMSSLQAEEDKSTGDADVAVTRQRPQKSKRTTADSKTLAKKVTRPKALASKADTGTTTVSNAASSPSAGIAKPNKVGSAASARTDAEKEADAALALAEAADAQRQLKMGQSTEPKRASRSMFKGFSKASSQTVSQKVADPEKPLPPGAKHYVKHTPMFPPWPAGMEQAMFGMGCFWCAENLFIQHKGVFSTQVGYAGGKMANPTYGEVSLDASFAKTDESGKRDHAEVVRVIFDPKEITYHELLKVFWEHHDPTQGNKQGRDEGYQYRSFIGCYSGTQKVAANSSLESFQFALRQRGVSRQITTEVRLPAPHFWYAEEIHQQYDAKPGSRSYCGLAPTGAKLR